MRWEAIHWENTEVLMIQGRIPARGKLWTLPQIGSENWATPQLQPVEEGNHG